MEVLSRYIIMEMAFMSFFSNRRQTEPETPQRTLDKPSAPALPSATQPQQQTPGFETVLGAHSVMEGKLESHANIRLDGVFTGTLQITGNILVGETAKITADINAKNVSIAGTVKGNVNGQKVQLLRTARLVGDISATSLTMEEGAFLDGKISMVKDEPETPSTEESASASVPSTPVTPISEPSFLDDTSESDLHSAQSDNGSDRF
jgi:cytoskeletal protein CcmA (bactofilin family)